MQDNYNPNIVKFYELNIKQNDERFFLSYAAKCKGEILELGIGTGRIGLKLAQLGYKVTGVDSSDSMLAELSKRVSELNIKNFNIVKGDLVKINLKKKFDLIIMPFRVFQQIHYKENQVKALENVYRHLSRKGIFVFNVFDPDLSILASEKGKELADFNNREVLRTHQNIGLDSVNQIIRTRIKIYNNKTKAVIATHVLEVSYFFQKELEFLLNYCKFKIISLRSNYISKKFKKGEELIFVCQKNSQ